MKFEQFASYLEKLEATTKRLEMTSLLVELFKQIPSEQIDKAVYLLQGKLHPDWAGFPEIGMAEKMVAQAIGFASGLSKEQVMKMVKEIGEIGVVAERLIAEKKVKGLLEAKECDIAEVYEALDQIALTTGAGSQEKKVSMLAGLLKRVGKKGAKYVTRIVLGRLRVGIGDMTILDALAIAFGGGKEYREELERAYNLVSDLGFIAKLIAEKGIDGIKGIKVQLGRPVRMMLAQRLAAVEEIIEKLEGKCSAEFKYDGERMQIHKKGDEIAIFSRRLENITSMYPDAVELIRKHIKAKEAIVEAEAVAVHPDSGELLPFQELMKRRRKYEIEEKMKELPISLFLFDCLFVEGRDLTKKGYEERRKALSKIVEEGDRIKVVPRLKSSDAKELTSFFDKAVAEGCEGLLIKSTDPSSIYRAGARSWLWVKWKRSYSSKMVEPVDLVVVGAFMGRGKRAGTYGALLAAAYNKKEDCFETVCKVGSGYTDEVLKELPEMLKPYQSKDKHARVKSLLEADVWFVPAVVMEVIGDEITISPVHTCAYGEVREGGGLAIRFPRFTGRWRPDKRPEDATTTEEIIEMYKAQLKAIK